ncbi:MAG TPA: PPC domain-containing DNA-binding protein [Candidatus Saccharimonadales bacterium]|nr:PPC domain-containing DNA-binding protein [Candidatus Saccharimonadales bacterium]
MHYSAIKDKLFLIRLERGEEVNSSIKRFCEKLGIKNAMFTGIGSIENPTVAHYRVDSRKYSEKKLRGIFEVTSFMGNVAVFEGHPLVHGHISLSDEGMRAFGGHLVEADVSATLEIMLQDLGSGKSKKFDKEIGLKLFNLDKRL